MYVGEYYIQNILKDRRKESEQEIIKWKSIYNHLFNETLYVPNIILKV